MEKKLEKYQIKTIKNITMTYYIKLETKPEPCTKQIVQYLRHRSRFRKAAVSVRVRGRGSDVTHTGSGQDWKWNPDLTNIDKPGNIVKNDEMAQ